MTYNPENFILSNECPVPRIIKPGEHLYVFCSNNFYVRALVDEVCFIHSRPNFTGEIKPVIWKSLRLDGIEDEISPSKLEGTVITNIFPWVDWPIGHAAYYGDYSFFSLEDARQTYGRFSKRKKYRRARQYLQRKMSFISHTHKMAGTLGPNWPLVESLYRKIYV